MNAPSHPARGTASAPCLISPKKITEQLCALHRLIEDLSLVQRRLGTPLEDPRDYGKVCELGHEIRNQLHVMQLWSEVGLIDMRAPTADFS